MNTVGRFLVVLLGGVCSALAFANGPDIRDLAPFRLYPVSEPSVGPAVPLPEPDSLTEGFYGLGSDQDIDTMDDYDVFWRQEDFQKWRWDRLGASATQATEAQWKRGPRTRAAWLPRASTDPWTLGVSNWRYAGERGLDVTLGSHQLMVPSWSSATRMGGVSVTQSDRSAMGNWDYALSLGALDYAPAQQQGDLVYGPTASNAVLRYGLSSRFILESQLETAPGLVTAGLGAQYQTPGWGSLHAGVSQASTNQPSGWKYQAAYQVDVTDTLNLSWLGAAYTQGYADLGHYQQGAASLAGARQQVAARLSLGRWGDVGGVYENTRNSLGELKRSFGLTQQLWYSSNLLIGLKAEREVHSGDYDIGLHLSVPIH
ncbi:MAG: hypothetical protein KA735_08955 [Burkholderiaceae bacterium]|nr:hypothetical protein [Burkholderiaceae bacterium]